jgi:hypothetical protein
MTTMGIDTWRISVLDTNRKVVRDIFSLNEGLDTSICSISVELLEAL